MSDVNYIRILDVSEQCGICHDALRENIRLARREYARIKKDAVNSYGQMRAAQETFVGGESIEWYLERRLIS